MARPWDRLLQAVSETRGPICAHPESGSGLIRSAQNLHEAVALASAPGQRWHWPVNQNTSLAEDRPGSLQGLLGLAHPGNLGRGVDHRGMVGVVHLRLLPGDAFATANPSSEALCASIGPRTQSPIAYTFGKTVRQ